mgnify:CR=1 FL=1
MSHEIKYGIYPEKVNKKNVQINWDNYVAHEDWQEGASGLARPIRWIEGEILASREEAYEYIAKHDSGDYDQLAVRFRDVYIEPETSKKYDTLVKRLNNLKTEYESRNSIAYATTVKSEYIGCKHCGSKLAARYIQNTNKCPLCHSDLRSVTALANLKRLKERISEVEKQFKEEKKKLDKKLLKVSEIKWLVKVEYHI